PRDTVSVEEDRGVAHDGGGVVRVVGAGHARHVGRQLADAEQQRRPVLVVLDLVHHASRPGTRSPPRPAAATASSYPASTCRRTPSAGSLDSTRSSFCPASGVPSATETCP